MNNTVKQVKDQWNIVDETERLFNYQSVVKTLLVYARFIVKKRHHFM